MRSLKPAFQEQGILTVGNSPSCNDGAAALVIMSEDEATTRELRPWPHRGICRSGPGAGMVYDRAD